MQPKVVSLDYFIGRTVTSVANIGEDWEWAITLAGNCVIRNQDKRRTAMPEIPEESHLMLVTFGELDTELHFGISNERQNEVLATVTLTPTKYTIADPVYTDGQEIEPQMPEELSAFLPDDPSAERVAEGPDVEEAENAPESVTEEEESHG